MQVFIEQVINGLTIGSFYALIALGYSMVYGILKLINFAHGDFFALGSYLGYTVLIWGSAFLAVHFGLWGGIIVALTTAAVSVALVGITVERLAYRPIYPSGGFPPLSPLWGHPFSSRTPSWLFGGLDIRLTLPHLFLTSISTSEASISPCYS